MSTRTKSWVLTDVAANVWLDSFALSNTDLPQTGPGGWCIQKRTLHGGLQDGVDLIEVNNGALSFSVLPTRGMAVWRGQYRDLTLGWQSPVQGPVHPKFVNQLDRGGLGWLSGFDEWICRCGLHSNGPPGEDPPRPPPDRGGQGGGEFLTLHGRIANLPAHYVEVRVNLDRPYELMVIGQVDEATLFFPNLHLTTTLVTTPGSNRLVIQDAIENRGSKSAEVELLYHCQFGPPFLEAGSRFRAPMREIIPRNDHAAKDVAQFDTYAGPTSGFVEQVYFFDLLTDSSEQSLALLHNARADRGVVLRMNKKELPHFIVWKNTAATEDGYVTGLEPAINLPNFKAFEREHGRVMTLPPHGRYACSFSVEVHDSAASVASVVEEIEALQGETKPIVHSRPQPKCCQ